MTNPLNPYLYQIYRGEYTLDGQSYTGFGISVVSTASNQILILIEDIALSQKELCKLVRLCNELALDPIHIYDVVEDFLNAVH